MVEFKNFISYKLQLASFSMFDILCHLIVSTHARARAQEQHIYAMCKETLTLLVMVSITNILATTITKIKWPYLV